MSFASDVKGEICNIQYDDLCCVRAELAGMLCFGASIRTNQIRLRTEYAMVAQRFYDSALRLYGIDVPVQAGEGRMFLAELEGSDVRKILQDTKLTGVPLRIHESVVRQPCCKMAFVRGCFLGSGSMTDPSRGYHAEMATTYYTLCDDAEQLFKQLDIAPKRLNRNGVFVLYLKDSEQIENLLAALGAHSKMMDFLNVKIEKDLRNKTNRLANCDIANVQKTVSAATAQRAAIYRLSQNGGLSQLPADLQEVAQARLDHPEASLSELARQIGMSKSGVNHRMRRLMDVASEERNCSHA